jgi:hypothetical protein
MMDDDLFIILAGTPLTGFTSYGDAPAQTSEPVQS